MNQFLKNIFTGYSPEKFVAALLSEQSLLCSNCGFKNPIAVEEALVFQHCARCNFAILVPFAVAGFVLFEPLGAGGISSVYKAYHRDTGKTPYAVKVIRTEKADDEKSVKVFQQEVDVHQNLPEHPNIVRFVTAGCENDEHYYAMEFVNGKRLKSLLDRGSIFPQSETLRIISQLLSALQHVLDNGILYRDVSAGNIILQPKQITLIDFGLAIPIEEAAQDSHDETVWGTGEYIPPERIYKKAEDESSVIYSIGMLIFHMATGKAFIKSDNIVEQAKRHISSARLAVTRNMMPNYSPRLSELVGQMIRPDPADRPQSFAEIASALAELSAK